MPESDRTETGSADSGRNPVCLIVDSKLRIDPETLPGPVLESLRNRLVFPNPRWMENRRRGFSNWRTRKTLSFLRELKSGTLTMPRGFVNRARAILLQAGLSVEIDDRTRQMPEEPTGFRGTLAPHQEESLQRVLSRRFGVLQAPTGSGKTVMALAAVAARSQPAVIVVHSKELMSQWAEAANRFLGIPSRDVGLIGDGHHRVGSALTIAIINSLYRRTSEVRKQTGFLIVDECHRAPARTFTRAVAAFDCRYMLGLSATPYRKDGLTPLIHLYLGDRVHEIGHRELVERNVIVAAEVRIRETTFRYSYADDYQAMMTALTGEAPRNRLIIDDVEAWVFRGGGTVLVVSDRVEHCRLLATQLAAREIETRSMTGSMPRAKRQEAIDAVKAGEVRVVVASLQLIGEGFDLPALSALFLATPISFTGRTIQTLGRILRTAEGKTSATVYDYVDPTPILRHAYGNRARVYRKLGFDVVGDGSGQSPVP